jgi:hypothetical protein
MKKLIVFWSLALLCACPSAALADSDSLYARFVNPPQENRPRVWWHWMNGNITPEGIRKDILWMNRVGIGGYHCFDAGMATPQVVKHRLDYMSDEWKAAFHSAVALSDSLGMEVGIAAAPGWSATGGPWVPKQDAMKKVVWREQRVKGGRTLSLPLPEGYDNAGTFQNVPLAADETTYSHAESQEQFYRDISVLAVKLPDADRSLADLRPQVLSSGGKYSLDMLTDGDLATSLPLPAEKGGQAWIEYAFEKPQTFCALSVVDGNVREHWDIIDPYVTKYLEVSDDGSHYRRVCDIPHGGAARQTITFEPTTAKRFRLVVDNPQVPNTLESRMGLIVEPDSSTAIAEWVLYTTPRVNHAEEKAGFASTFDLERFPSPDSSTPIALKDIVDVTSFVHDGVLHWKAPKGQWLILRMGYSLTGKKNHPASPEATGLEVDKMDSAAFSRYINTYLDMYADATEGLMGKHGIGYLLTDSYEAGQENWTPALEEEFSRRKGYELCKYLPTLTGLIVGSTSETERFLWDFRQVLGQLVVDNQYRQLANILHRRGMKLYAESQENGRQFLPDGMAVKAQADIPMAAMWIPTPLGGSTVQMAESDLRESASTAHLYGRKWVAAESLTSIGYGGRAWSFTPETLKPTADLELACGLSRFVIHESTHQPVDSLRPGLGLHIFGQWFNRLDTWAEEAKAWTDYLARSSFMMTQGRFVADILYYYGEDNCVTGLYGKTLPDIPKGYNFDYVNADALTHLVEADKAQLVTPSGINYRLLALGDHTRRMSLPVLEKIHSLVLDGVTLVGKRPTQIGGLTDDSLRFVQLVADIWQRHRANVFEHQSLSEVLQKMGVKPDMETAADSLRFVHHKLDDSEFYWLNNRTGRFRTLQVTLRTSGLKPQIWHAEDGSTEDVDWNDDGQGTSLTLRLTPHDAVFVVFAKSHQPATKVVGGDTLTVLELPTQAEVTLHPATGEPSTMRTLPLADWSQMEDEEMKYFSGTVDYEMKLKVTRKMLRQSARALLNLGEVKNLAHIVMNGKDVGTLWKTPFETDVLSFLEEGENTLKVSVTNTWVNRLIGDEQPDCQQRHTYTSLKFYKADSPLLPSGWMGPARLMFIAK